MPIDILMPALSPTMEVGNLAKWHVKEGDTVSSGDIIAEIETDKAIMEIEAIDEGVVGKILVAEGTADIPVNQLIAVLLEDGEDASAISSVAPAAPASTEAPATETESATPIPAPAASSASAPIAAPANGAERIFASPLARRIAASEGLDLAKITGSGPKGRIVKRDIEEAVQSGGAKTAPAPMAASSASAPAPSMSSDAIRAMYEDGSYEEIPHNAMRRIVAARLTESKQTVPHFYLTIECEIDRLLAMRKEINGGAPEVDGKPAYKISVNDFVIKAMAMALRAVPMANATWTDDARLIHKHSDIGVAVAVEDGLFTPVIRKADEKSLSTISNEMKDMAGRARNKKLAPHEYQGGSTAISNLGMFGIREFSAVINPPQGTILAVGAGAQQPIVKDGALAIATVMSVTLSCDHRVVDGALGAELLAAFKNFIETPLRLFV
ncbi:MAG: pyruvate dehydrogenase complex dihydrolipoamide acetyltransferase [Rhizobiales bacterium]|nr:pyruvate dehydrogenase complex dihydrolipoamide acetyltransferase [Hyphomicrobiales bacterium]